MSTTAALDVAAVRARFNALQRPLAFFDGPGGTQCPDEVIDAISGYLRESNANVGGSFETSRRTVELIEHARERAADFLRCSTEEVAFGPSMTALNFLLTRAFARTLSAGDEVLIVTWLHEGKRDVLEVYPRGDRSNLLTGVFATRSPDRPNPLGLHRVTVRAIDGPRLRIGPIEAIDGTPVVDIKPVLAGDQP